MLGKTNTIMSVGNEAIDLSMFDVYGNEIRQSTANCYVIRKKGTYKFPLVYGNAIKNGKVNTAAFTNNGGGYSHDFVDGGGQTITSPWLEDNSTSQHTIPVAIDIKNADIETNGVIDVTYNRLEDKSYVYITVHSIPIEGGNVILSARGTPTLWSWHIWLWPHDLSPVEITNSTGVKYNIMPVNLASKYDSDGVHIKNWFYQWGRMTPLLCPASYNSPINHSPGTITTASKAATIGNGIANVNTFYCNTSSPYNWFGTKSYYNLWDAACTGAGNSDNDTVKTVYDPCPVGWKVPNGNTFTGLSVISNANGIVKMARYSGDTTGVEFPWSGCRDNSDGSIYYVGSYGYVWLSSAYSQSGAYRLYFYSGNVYPQNNSRRAYGFSVRPVEDDEIRIDTVTFYFHVGGVGSFKAETGMSWFEWINSEYNTANAVVMGRAISFDGGNTILYDETDSSMRPYYIYEDIIGNKTYYSTPVQ